jgi:antitoxin component YwqK of YwqJK toxin-antitoxin module
MKIFASFMILLACSCFKNNSKEINNQEQSVLEKYVLKSSKEISIKNDVVFFNGKIYNGFLYEMHPNTKDTIAIEGYFDGVLHGLCKKWYPNKKLLEERFYSHGEKNGKQIAYWENGNKKFEFIAKNDAYEGEMREYTFDGRLIHLATYTNGQEEGTQKMWYDNGKIRANYVIIKGKRYGLLGTKNCKNVSDSIFVVK